jgi:hypothetical protein
MTTNPHSLIVSAFKLFEKFNISFADIAMAMARGAIAAINPNTYTPVSNLADVEIDKYTDEEIYNESYRYDHTFDEDLYENKCTEQRWKLIGLDIYGVEIAFNLPHEKLLSVLWSNPYDQVADEVQSILDTKMVSSAVTSDIHTSTDLPADINQKMLLLHERDPSRWTIAALVEEFYLLRGMPASGRRWVLRQLKKARESQRG